jgi:hypothetical protein
MMVGIVTVICIMMIGVYQVVSNVNINAAGSHKARDIAIQAADAGVNQFISDITNRKVDIIGATLPLTRDYEVQIGATSLTVPITCDLLTSGGVPVVDLEGNSRYVVDAIATPIIAYGAGVKTPVARHVQANLSIVNLSKYNSFTIGNDIWATSSGTFDGPYHTNGSVMSIGGTMWWNSSVLSGGTANPFWSDTYVTMAAGSFVQADGYGAPTFYTMASKFGRLSSSGLYNICTTGSRPNGTWLDKAHGGVPVNIRPIPYSTYYNYAQVILSLANLPNYKLNGADVSCTAATNLQIDVGVNGLTNRVKINLGAFGTGSTNATNYDIFQGATNYAAALNSAYGIIIYSLDDIAVYGQLATATGLANTNKKVMIISQKSIEVIGDILYSGDTFTATLDSYNPTTPAPVPATSNPNNDAIALICTDNIYVNPWRKADTTTPFFRNSNDMKIVGFLYGYSGALSGGGRSYKGGGSSNIGQFTTFGGQTFLYGGIVPGTFNIGYDPNLNTNISKLVPVGVGVISWMEIE